MKGGVLEVLLVGAEGLRHPSFFGHSFKFRSLLGNASHYVVIRCGKVTYKSKIKSGNGQNASWNEKFSFKFPFSDLKNSSDLHTRIMDRNIFRADDFLGETIIHLGGILEEGSRNGWLELKPAPYNIVAEDGTYHGTIKIGLKYIDNVEVDEEIKETTESEKQPRPLCKTIVNFIRAPWLNIYFHLRHANNMGSKKNG